MYLTCFPINRTRRLTPQLLASPHRLHAAIAGSFPLAGEGRENCRVLWRVDIEASGASWVYIVSPTPPSLVGLDEQIGFPDHPPTWRIGDYGPFLQRISVGQLWAFRLVANPVRTVARDHGSGPSVVGKRIGHVTVEQQTSWLIGAGTDGGDGSPRDSAEDMPAPKSRAARNGFEVLNDRSGGVQLLVSNRRKHEIHRRDGSDPIRLDTAQYDGVLRVTDAEKLRHALTHGIGHGKAFGCGLLTLAPLP